MLRRSELPQTCASHDAPWVVAGIEITARDVSVDGVDGGAVRRAELQGLLQAPSPNI